ncbi:MAG: hypothetical protein LBN39_02130 [Planctomycetaceae bacterium]|jgi:DNA repair exonuclease SbcCD ATPase subunit|nr:hypothetical protein [Planctomycetaceae bacterium]
MTVTEALKQVKGQSVEPVVAEIVEQLLQLTPPQTERIAEKLNSWLKKTADSEQLAQTRSEIMSEISKLNAQRNNLRTDGQEAERSLKEERQKLVQESSNLNVQQRELEELKAKNAKKQVNVEQLQNELNAMPKESEIKKKYEATKKMLDAVKENPFLVPMVADTIQRVWKELPADELDKKLSPKPAA